MSSTDGSSGYFGEKRTDYISWDDYFMATALLAAQRSKDPRTQVGACLVNSDNVIVGVGYNGFPKGCSDNEFSWAKRKDSKDNKHLYVCHAEVNAILNKNSGDLKNCRMYVTLFPCNECAKYIIQSYIKEVFYISDKNQDRENKAPKEKIDAAKKMFDAAGVTYRRFYTKQKNIILDFGEAYNPLKKRDGNSESSPSPPKKSCGEEINSSN